MPIVDVEIVLKPDEIIPDKMVSELADQLGEIFGSSKNGTWIKVHRISRFHYAENGGNEEEVYPIFVSVLKSKLSNPEDMQNEVEAITGAVAQVFNRPSSYVHVIYQPEGKGRVAFGGKIVL
jgi:phenylpyruvate tautomerase PptA (4-oxalocrotonate tautomerase family)